VASMAEIPRIDIRPEGDVRIRPVDVRTPRIGRRNVLRVAAAGGMALGITALGWIPTARRRWQLVHLYAAEDLRTGWPGTKRLVLVLPGKRLHDSVRRRPGVGDDRDAAQPHGPSLLPDMQRRRASRALSAHTQDHQAAARAS
jgi:hypothetical protein